MDDSNIMNTGTEKGHEPEYNESKLDVFPL
jgi:hypothetical protein